jgi:calcineurin-like phosphoesterase family protein
MNYWFTSDWHLSHYNLMKELGRPFNNIDEMDDFITEMFYDAVSPGDQIYFLGDLGWKREGIEKFFERKPKNIHFHMIWGNHDKKMMNLIKPFASSVGDLKDIKIERQHITLCHYMMYTWNKSHYGAWHLYGHHHTEVDNEIGKTLNVCLDVNKYQMLNYDEVKAKMNSRPNNHNLLPGTI